MKNEPVDRGYRIFSMIRVSKYEAQIKIATKIGEHKLPSFRNEQRFYKFRGEGASHIFLNNIFTYCIDRFAI